MGMYTELLLKCKVKEQDELSNHVLDFLFRGDLVPSKLPDHPFFKTERWQHIGRSASFYHHPESVGGFAKGELGREYLFSRSDLKNYSEEIEKFLDWFMPMVDETGGKCIGWKWYEEDETPTLLFKCARAEDS